MKKVLFVCLGNICRSPAAEGVFRDMVRQAGLEGKIKVDSAGTGGWHEGDSPDGRMIQHARQRGYDLSDLEARQIRAPEDLSEYDYILTMDSSNLRNVLALDVKKEHHHKVKPLVSFCRIHSVQEVPDPYYREADGFEHVLDLIEDACRELLQHVKKELSA
ncbi:MAG: low molecular weight phosphotyrosine protein phosphatase [Bdellovibrionales bacterium]|nr:low molecular weight phosphotyrosine protein phosphatase [Bdellovibrionales bacterium]